MTNFVQLASPFAELGIRVFPLAPRTKEPLSGCKFLTAASTDYNQLESWAVDEPDANVALLADDQFCFLEFDIADGMQQAAEEMGEEMPLTMEQRSGRGFGHFIFLHTARSRAIGNRSVNLTEPCHCAMRDAPMPCTRACVGARHHHHEWFSFRARNKYLVGAGSTHPSGTKYEAVNSLAPIAVPEWLCDWIEKHSRVNLASPVGSVSVHEDFDFEDLMDHYGIGGRWKDHWFITSECPVADYKHQQSRPTGFYYDGNTFGFNCFAQGCEGSQMSAGKVIALLNERTSRPYTGPIWDREEEDEIATAKWDIDDLDADLVDDLVDDDDDSVMHAKVELAVVESVPVEVPTTRILSADEVIAILEMLPDEPVAHARTEEDDLAELIIEQKASGELPMTDADFDQPQPDVSAVALASDATGMEFPGDSAMYGKLAEIARAHSRMPLGWLYPSLLGVASALPHETDAPVRPNIYVANLGDIGSGKTASQELALKLIHVPSGDTVIARDAPGSHSGLLNQLYEDEPKPLLIFPDELKTVLTSCSIEGANLTPMLCTLWNRDEVGSSVKKGRQKGYALLSIVGGLPVTDAASFGKLFGAAKVSGLYDRFLFGYSSAKIRFKPTTVRPHVFDLKPVVIRGWAWDALHAWQDLGKNRGRIGENAMRVALITASINGDKEVTRPCFEAALRFMEWQERLRATFQSGVAETKESEAFEAVYSALKEAWEEQKRTKKAHKDVEKLHPAPKDAHMLLHFRAICNSKSYYRKYSGLIDRVRKALVRDEFVQEYVEETEDDSGRIKKHRTPFVILKTLVR